MDQLTSTVASALSSEAAEERGLNEKVGETGSADDDDDIVIEINIPTAEEVAQTAAQLSERAANLGNTAKETSSAFFSKISSLVSENFQIIPGDSSSSAARATSKYPKSFDRRTATITALRLDSSTYLDDPALSSDTAIADRYSKFLEGFSVAEYSTKIARVVESDANVASVLESISMSTASFD